MDYPPPTVEHNFPGSAGRVAGSVRRLGWGRHARRAGSSLLLLGALGLGGMMVIPSLVGFERYVITGRSMTGSLDRGSVAFERVVPVSSLRVGDVITYEPPPGAGPSGLVTHRIVRIGRDKAGARVFRTKGDFNRSADPWRFSLHRPTQARVAFDVPYVGYLLAGLGIRWLRMLLIGLPALAIGLAVAVSLWRQAGVETCGETKEAKLV